MFKSVCGIFFHFLKIFFFTLLFLLAFPLLFLSLFVPIYLFRFVATQLRKIFRPDLDKLVNTRSAVLAIDSPYKKPCWNLCVWLTLEGNLNFENFQYNFLQKIVLKKLSNGKFANPEYQQHFEKWLGFLFWRWESDFNILDHMKYYFSKDCRNKVTTEDELKNIIKELTWKSFVDGKSPWEFLYIANYLPNEDKVDSSNSVPKKSVLILRVHHGFCDGFTILRILMKDVNNISLTNVAQREYTKKSIIVKIFQSLIFWLRGPYDLMEMLVASNDKNKWHLKNRKLQRPFNTSFTHRIPLNYIKEIKNINRVSFSSVVIASITGGLRNMMIGKGMDVPEFMTTAIAVPMPGHPNKLRNHFIFSFINLPVGIENIRKRVKAVEKNWTTLKNSPVALFNFGLIPIVGGLFPCMMKLFTHNVYSTALLSNFPGPPETTIFIGGGGSNKVTDMNFSAGLGQGNVGIGFCMMSYDHGMRIISSADQSVLKTDSDVDQLNQYIIDELALLKSLDCV